MNTDDLIRSLVQDQETARATQVRRIASMTGLCGIGLSLAMLGVILGVRPDAGTALQSWRLPFKIMVVGVLIATSVRAYARAANPESLRVRSLGLLLLAPALLFGGVIFELLDGPSSEWLLKVAGKNPTLCLIAIPCLSIAPLIGLLMGQRHGAPASPTLAGALTGLLAGSLGAAVYILRCTDDSPLFVAIWYMTAILIVTGAGGVIGRKLLCW